MYSNEKVPYGAEKSSDSQMNAQNLLKQIENFELKIMVDIILVGFDQDNDYKISTPMLQTYFDRFTQAFRKEQELVHFKTEDPEKMIDHTSIRRKVLYRAAKTVPSLGDKLNTAISTAKESSEADTESKEKGKVATVPIKVVDDLIRTDFQKLGVSYSLYIIRSGVSGDYRYVTGETSGEDDNKEECEFGGAVGERRYAWVDLDAGPLDYGPSRRGHGGVSPQTLLRPRELVEESKQAASMGLQPADRDVMAPLYPEIVALSHRTVQQLIAPSLVKPPSTAEKIVLDLFHICASKTSLTCPGLQEDFETAGQTLQAQLESMQLIGQNIQINIHFAHIVDDPLLASGLSSALEVVDDAYILDSAELHSWLSKIYEAHGPHGYEGGVGSDSSVLKFPAFVIELDTEESVLLDGLVPSKSFEDLVVAVYTQAEDSPSGLFCQGQNPAPYRSGYLFQYLLSSILESVWGVLPRHTTFNPLDHRLDTDYLWATGSGLHSPLSSSEKYVFPEHDAPRQGMLLLKFEEILSTLQNFLTKAAEISPRSLATLGPKEMLLLEKQWQIAWSGLEKASTYFSLHNFNYAWQLIDSSEAAVADFQQIYTQYLQSSWQFSLDDGTSGISSKPSQSTVQIPTYKLVLSTGLCTLGMYIWLITAIKYFSK